MTLCDIVVCVCVFVFVTESRKVTESHGELREEREGVCCMECGAVVRVLTR